MPLSTCVFQCFSLLNTYPSLRTSSSQLSQHKHILRSIVSPLSSFQEGEGTPRWCHHLLLSQLSCAWNWCPFLLCRWDSRSVQFWRFLFSIFAFARGVVELNDIHQGRRKWRWPGWCSRCWCSGSGCSDGSKRLCKATRSGKLWPKISLFWQVSTIASFRC